MIVLQRVPLGGGAPATLRLDGAASAMAFDAAGGVQAVTRNGAVAPDWTTVGS